MLRSLVGAFTHPLAGPIGFGLALFLCVLLVGTSISASHTEARLRARILQLAHDDARTGALLSARLSACESAQPAPSTQEAAIGGTAQARAQQLASRSPQGFDVCARMEAADRAVLESLR